MKELMSLMKAKQSTSIQFSDDLPSHILPFYQQSIQKHGENCFLWFGTSPRLVITDPQMMRYILGKPDLFPKVHRKSFIGKAIVGGLFSLEGDKWSANRKIINLAFHLDKLKNMTLTIQLSYLNMMDKWEAALVCGSGNSQEIDAWPYLQDLSGDVISRTAFGTSYEQGRRIFELHKEQLKLVFQLMQSYFIPGWRYLPTKANKRMKAISDEIKSLLRDIINKRDKATERGETNNDDELLGTLMESNYKEIQEQHGNKNVGMSIDDVIEECKLFYFVGSETTSILLVWTMILLSRHQEWKTRAREEVVRIFGTNEPTFDGLKRLKIVTMILQEAMRLYTPAPFSLRAPTETTNLGNLTIPVGTQLLLVLSLLHHDPKIWGDDVKNV